MSLRHGERPVSPSSDCAAKLSDLSGLSSLQISAIAEELARKTEDASRQQEEITHLLSQIVDLQKKAKSVSLQRQGQAWATMLGGVSSLISCACLCVQYAVENEELTQHLVAAKDAQRQLTAEVILYSPLLRSRVLPHPGFHCSILNPRAASGAGGEILRVHRDAARSPGGAKEPQEPELPHGNPSTVPPAGALPHGEGVRVFVFPRVCSVLCFTSFTGSCVPGFSGG